MIEDGNSNTIHMSYIKGTLMPFIYNPHDYPGYVNICGNFSAFSKANTLKFFFIEDATIVQCAILIGCGRYR